VLLRQFCDKRVVEFGREPNLAEQLQLLPEPANDL